MIPPHSSYVITTWKGAEINAFRWMQVSGFSDARLTSGGADGGIDVVSSLAVAQVKFCSNPIGRPDLQRLVGAASIGVRRQLFFFSYSSYTTNAIEYADMVGMLLFTYDIHGMMYVANRHASAFVSSRPHTTPYAAAADVRSPKRRYGCIWWFFVWPFLLYWQLLKFVWNKPIAALALGLFHVVVAFVMPFHRKAGESFVDVLGPALVALIVGSALTYRWWSLRERKPNGFNGRNSTSSSKEANSEYGGVTAGNCGITTTFGAPPFEGNVQPPVGHYSYDNASAILDAEDNDRNAPPIIHPGL